MELELVMRIYEMDHCRQCLMIMMQCLMIMMFDAFVKSIGTPGRSRTVTEDLQNLLYELGNDLDFLTSGAEVASGAYSKALQVAMSSERTMMDLAWSAVGFEELVKKVRSFQVEVNGFVQQGGDGEGGGAIANLGLM